MEDDLDIPIHTGGNDAEFLRQEIQELDLAVVMLSLTAPILVTMVAALLCRHSRKTAALLREAVGASAAASSHAQGLMTVEIKGAEGMPDMRCDFKPRQHVDGGTLLSFGNYYMKADGMPDMRCDLEAPPTCGWLNPAQFRNGYMNLVDVYSTFQQQ